MTETRGELIDRGWELGWVPLSDRDIVQRMHCKNPQCTGTRLYAEAWIKPGERGKQFTQCRKCGHRRLF